MILRKERMMRKDGSSESIFFPISFPVLVFFLRWFIGRVCEVKKMNRWTRMGRLRHNPRRRSPRAICLSIIWMTTMRTRSMRLVRLCVSLLLDSRAHIHPGPFSTIKGLTYYRDNNDDPYITLKEVKALYSLLVISDSYSCTGR